MLPVSCVLMWITGGECLSVLFDPVAVLIGEGITLALVSVFVGVMTWR